mmetsp:Transcript_16063/g.34799  ORF Transcript_16063/g.34799 Transcript_16063/m.34799 type:complete len:136 (+) Transcript_16063:59-466(+)
MKIPIFAAILSVMLVTMVAAQDGTSIDLGGGDTVSTPTDGTTVSVDTGNNNPTSPTSGAADTCKCMQESKACVVINPSPLLPEICTTSVIPCTTCTCAFDGTLDCDVVDGQAYEFTGEGGFCNVVQTKYAVCPPV